MMKIPKVVFVRVTKYSSGDEGLDVFASMADAVEGDGPTTISVFKYVETVKRRKILAPA